MLDDLKYIHQRDAQDALGIAEKQWQQLEVTYDVERIAYKGVENVVLAGMGGSALASLLLQTWPGVEVPFEIARSYYAPLYAGPKTLFIASSYSGNTEETLEALTAAEGQGCQIVVLASGGTLGERAAKKGYPYFKIPDGYQPRHAVLFGLKALVALLEPAGLIGQGSIAEMESAAEFLKTAVQPWLPTVATKDNPAKQLALELMGKSPVIYAGPLLYPAAYKWKISFNENAKNIAWCNQYSELNHNEFLGWTSHPVDKPYGVIELRSSFEHKRIQKRFAVTERLLSGKRPSPHVVDAKGDTLLEHLLYCVALGDFVSLYLALLNGLNPTPVDLIETFKTALAE